ncbi:MAG: hypothetical protein GTO62_07845, partial [Planctomycetales bacterium]|nr:hypothetical protein [Planctomycetales bacterium]NIP69168.1 hypothetical protein [Planctomycetales bacterium]
MAAFVLIQIEVSGGMEGMGALHDALHAVDGVKSVHFLAGPTDVIVFVEAADQEALGESLGQIRGVNG